MYCDVCKVTIEEKLWEQHILGKRHQKVVHRKNWQREKAERGIFITKLPRDWSEVALHNKFSIYGPICDMIMDPNGRHVIIQYQNKAIVQTVLQEKHFLNNCELIVKARRQTESTGEKTNFLEVRLYDKVVENLTTTPDVCQQMHFLVQLVELTETELQQRHILCRMLRDAFFVHFPGCEVYMFGSTVNGLGFQGSDLDIYIDLKQEDSSWETVTAVGNPDKLSVLPIVSSQEERVRMATRILRKHREFTHIIPIPKARTPIVKFMYRRIGLQCDISFRSCMSVKNTNLIKFYTTLDERIRPLMMTIRYWSKRLEMSGGGGGNKISNYALTMLIIFYLQQLEMPLLPTVENLQKPFPDHQRNIIENWDCSFCTDQETYSISQNTQTVAELLLEFLNFYSNFDFGLHVVCPLVGHKLPKTFFLSDVNSLPQCMYRLKSQDVRPLKVCSSMCIQDPFELNYNLTGNISTKTLANFQSQCAAAESICRKITQPLKITRGIVELFESKINNANNQNSGKTDKYQKRANKTEDKFTLVIPVNKNFIPKASNTEGFEEKMKDMWYHIVARLVRDMFEKALKFECQELENNETVDSVKDVEPDAKKIKKIDGEGTSSCVSSNGPSTVTILHCKAFFRTWEGRKKLQKELDCPDNLGIIDLDEYISSYMLKREGQKAKPHFPWVDFTCKVTGEDNPSRVLLAFNDEGSHKNIFKSFCNYLQTYIPQTVEKCMACM